MHTFFWGCLAVVSMNVAAQTSYDLLLQATYKNTVPLIHANELDDKGGYIMLDTRQDEEYQVSHIQHAEWVGYDQFDPALVNDLPRDTTIIVYCSIGYRSERIGEQLLQMGFTKVYNLYGGIFEWVNLGYPVYTPSEQPTNKVHAYNKKWGVWLEKGHKVY